MALSSISIFTDCNCDDTSTQVEKMPLLTDYTPSQFSFTILVDQPPVYEYIPILGDTISYVCGNLDGTSWCGSDGNSPLISFYDPTTGKRVPQPYKELFYWNGKELVI